MSRSVHIDGDLEHPPLRRSLALALAVCSVPLLLAGTATAASAERAVVEHWVDDDTVTHADGSEDFCGELGFDVVEHGDAKGVLSVRAEGGRASGTSETASGARPHGPTPRLGGCSGRSSRVPTATR